MKLSPLLRLYARHFHTPMAEMLWMQRRWPAIEEDMRRVVEAPDIEAACEAIRYYSWRDGAELTQAVRGLRRAWKRQEVKRG